jgi:hypothetical protein
MKITVYVMVIVEVESDDGGFGYGGLKVVVRGGFAEVLWWLKVVG